jgi:hypothetical protein
MGNLRYMRLILWFRSIPTPRVSTYHGLPAGVDVDMLDRDLLLALATVAVEGFEQRGTSAGRFVRHGRRVGIRIVTFEACSGFTRVTARRIAQPPKVTLSRGSSAESTGGQEP